MKASAKVISNVDEKDICHCSHCPILTVVPAVVGGRAYDSILFTMPLRDCVSHVVGKVVSNIEKYSTLNICQ